MSKIKEIQSRLLKNPSEFASIRFSVAKQIFAMSAALYFLVYLFTVGGFYFGPFSLDSLAILRYHFYSLLIISVAFFGFSLIEFLTDNKIAKISAALFFGIFAIIALLFHVGIL